MIKLARNNECLRGFEVVTNQIPSLNANIEVTHLQYVDNTLIFCDARERQLLIVRSIFVFFQGVSGLHIIGRKSQLFPINKVRWSHLKF